MFRLSSVLLSLVFLANTSWAKSPLAPKDKTTPRASLKLFMDSMNAYVNGIKSGDSSELSALKDAVGLLDLSEITALKSIAGREAAIFLKEVIDRAYVPKYSAIPGGAGFDAQKVGFWTVPETEITLVLSNGKQRPGEFLFSAQTVERAKEFYEKIKHLPYLEGSGKGALYKRPWLEGRIPSWSKIETLGLYRWQWVGIFLSIFLGLLGKSLSRIGVSIVRKVASRSRTNWDDHVLDRGERPFGLIMAAVIWFVCINALQLEGGALTFLVFLVQAIFSLGVIWLFYGMVDVLGTYLKKVADNTDSSLDDQLVPLLTKAMRISIVIFGVLITIQNMGVNVMSLLAGLGLGGLAFALAAKDTAANLFGSIMILWDQPFKVGDWIVVGGSSEGTVEEVGFRSTRIRTFYNSQITIPNAEVANATVDNMGRRQFRRVVMDLGLTYDTTPNEMEAFLEGVKNIIKANEFTRKDYFHVVFKGYGAVSLDVMLYYFLKVPDWSQELVEKQNINIEILRLANDLGIEFAFPTQTLHVDSLPQEARKRGVASEDQLIEITKDFGPGGGRTKSKGLGIFKPPYLDKS